MICPKKPSELLIRLGLPGTNVQVHSILQVSDDLCCLHHIASWFCVTTTTYCHLPISAHIYLQQLVNAQPKLGAFISNQIAQKGQVHNLEKQFKLPRPF